MHIAACIVGFRNTSDIVQCIAALDRSTHRDLSVVICENGGEAAHAALVAALPSRLQGGGDVLILSAPDNPGYAGGFNRCVEATDTADGWWLVNPDCEPEPSALAALIARLAVGDCDAVGGTILRPDGTVQGYGGRFRPMLARAESIGHGTPAADLPHQATVEGAMNYILGASILANRRFWTVTGPMRDDYFLYAEEIEWCVRARAKGLRLGFAPDALIRHDQGSTTGSGETVARRPWLPVYLDERNKLHVVRDSWPLCLPIAALMALPLIALRYSRRGAWAQTRDALAGWWAGLRNERGKPARLAAPR